MALRVFRWRAIGPLLAFAAIGALLWAVFGEELARETSEEVGASVLGARVDIRRLDIDFRRADVTLRGITVASPFDSLRNLFEADEIVADVDPLPLLEKKLVIDRLAMRGVRVGTARTTSGFVRGGAGRVGAVRREVAAWGERFDIPALRLATGKLDVGTLDPARLETVRAAEALATRADSLRRGWEAAATGLDVGPVVDSARAALTRLRGARATDLRLLADARRALDDVKRARQRVATLERGVTDGITTMRVGLAALDRAKQRDYAFARELVRLPSLDAPDVAAALFAPVVIERFQRALYWAELGRRYMPPGLRPRATAGPPRVRAAGRSVAFPKEHAYPRFLLRDAELSIHLGDDAGAPRTVAARLTGLTTAPALYGKPTVFQATAPAVQVAALLDHVRASTRDTAGARVDGVPLPAFPLPGLPFRLAPGRGTVAFQVLLRGDTLRARWGIHAAAVTWSRDSARPAAGDVERLVGRVLAGVRTLDLDAEVRGPLAASRLAVRSNLDRAIADALRAAVGEEVAAAEQRLRAQVDRVVQERSAPARARAAELEQQAKTIVGDRAERLELVQRDLEQRVRETTGGIRLP